MQFPKHFFTFSALIPDYLQKDECVKMPSTCFVFVSQLYTWQREHGECCLTVFLTWAMVGAMVIFLPRCPNPAALLLQAHTIWPIICSQFSSFPQLLVCFEQTQMTGSMRHHVKTLPAQSLKERSLYKCLTYRSYSTFHHLSFCCKKACHHLPLFKIDPKEVRA